MASRHLGFGRGPEPVDRLGSAIDGLPRMQTFLSRAAYAGRAGVIVWARAQGCPWDDEVCPAAAYGGHATLLRDLRDALCPCSLDDCLVGAAAGGHLALARSIIDCIKADRDRPFESTQRHREWWKRLPVRTIGTCLGRALVAAVAMGHVDVARALASSESWWTVSDHLQGELAVCAMRHGMSEFAELCRRRLGDVNDASALAAERGDQSILSRLWPEVNRERRRTAVVVAALHGHADLVHWARSADASLADGDDDIAARLVDAILSLDRNTADQAFSSVTTVSPDALSSSWTRDLTVAAAYAGNLGVLGWLKFHRVHIRRVCTLAAAYNGHTHVLRWAREHGVRFSGLTTSVAAARGHRECALYCETQCSVPIVWQYNEPEWRRSRFGRLGGFAFGRKRHIAEMASWYGCAASAAELARRCPVVPVQCVLKALWLGGDYGLIVPLMRMAHASPLHHDLQRAAATKCRGDVLRALDRVPKGDDNWEVQDILLSASQSRYGWRNLFKWVADRGHRCGDCTMYNMLGPYQGPHAEEAFVWAVDRWCPWPPGNRYMMHHIPAGSRVVEWVLMSDEDPLIPRNLKRGRLHRGRADMASRS